MGLDQATLTPEAHARLLAEGISDDALRSVAAPLPDPPDPSALLRLSAHGEALCRRWGATDDLIDAVREYTGEAEEARREAAAVATTRASTQAWKARNPKKQAEYQRQYRARRAKKGRGHAPQGR